LTDSLFVIYNKFDLDMENKEILKKQIIYRSTHRGSKEMDLLLGNFVKRYINEFNVTELRELERLLFVEDEVIYNWYFKKDSNKPTQNNKILKMLEEFKF
tara:strand:- start:613 stop:912 length:300 start_codon:yes stop_codon:yes gene_type:complete